MDGSSRRITADARVDHRIWPKLPPPLPRGMFLFLSGALIRQSVQLLFTPHVVHVAEAQRLIGEAVVGDRLPLVYRLQQRVVSHLEPARSDVHRDRAAEAARNPRRAPAQAGRLQAAIAVEV